MVRNSLGNSSHLVGSINELRAAEFFMSNGWEIFFPLLTQSKADFIISKGKRVKKVQVKTITHMKTGPYTYKQCRLSSSNQRQGKFYKDGDFDYIVFVDGRSNEIYLAPFEDIVGLTSVCFGNDNPNPKVHPKTYDVSKWKVRN